MTFLEQLNRYNVGHSVEKGKVSLEACPDDIDDLCGPDGTVTDKDFDTFLDALEKTERYLDDHPYGREGGYVAWVEHGGERYWYSESECEWVE